MKKIFSLYVEQKKTILSKPLPPNTTIDDVRQALVYRYRESLNEVEKKLYEAVGITPESVQKAISLYQDNEEFINTIKPLTVWQKILADEELPFPKVFLIYL